MNRLLVFSLSLIFLSHLFPFTSITTGLMFLNIAAQRFNGLNLRIVSYCCIFVGQTRNE